MMACPTCHGLRWTCEDHRNLPQGHDGCGGGGVPCPDCQVAGEKPQLPEGWVPIASVFDGLVSDPGFPLNCPICGAPTIYQLTVDGTHIYRCQRHGWLELPPSGVVRLKPQ